MLIGVVDDRFDELTEAQVEFLVDDPAPHAPDAPTAHRELLDGGRELVVGDTEQVAVDGVGEHDGVLREHRFDRGQLVAQFRGCLVLLPV